jgi:hypothetical protein
MNEPIAITDWWLRSCDVTCETCKRHERFQIKAPSPQQAHADLALAEQLQQAGWRQIGCDDYCPECASFEQPGLWEA